MRTYREEYEYWLASDVVDEKTKEELRALEGKDEEIEGRFKAMLTFGTAGLRGIMGAGIGCMNVYTVRYATQGLANLVIANGGQIGGDSKEGNGVAIAHDSRLNSRLFAEEAASVLAANGIKVYIFDDMRPTPELSFAVRETKSIAGINITASHNPKEYNGYKAYWADGAQLGPEHADVVSAEIAKVDIFKDVKTTDYKKAVEDGIIEILGDEMDEVYISRVMETSVTRKYIDQVAKEMKIVFTPFHGAGYKLVPEILRRQGYGAIIPVEEQMIPDGNFPTVKSPNPENTEGFALAIEYAKKNGAELVIGVDPDSDRCGAVVKAGDDYKILTGNQEACLMMDYIFTVRKELGTMPKNPFVCKSIVSTVMANKIADYNNVKMYEVLTGFKFIGEKIKEHEENGDENFVFGFEESIGFLGGSYARDKDAVYAAMMMAEMACWYKARGMSVYDGLIALYEKYGWFIENTESTVFAGFDSAEKREAVMARIRENAPEEIGLKVESVTDYLGDVPGFTKSNVLFYNLADGCAVAVRPSGTEPKIKTYVMVKGDTPEKAEENRKAVRDAVDALLS
ncbi:MAG: phospho-sugar mutase [Mogibacterium sp.]|nr:phospho-sugar mutase [Mogibacterium sp.]MBR3376754.1 phospho-sugar mutase [Mogibacterium sp.]